MSGTRASNDRPPSAGGVKRGRLQHEAATTGSRVTVVLGAQWGDEGKGKVVDLLATDADIISRCQVRAGRRAPPPPAQGGPPTPIQTDPALPALLPSPTRPLDAFPPGTPSPVVTPTHSGQTVFPPPPSPRDPAFLAGPTPRAVGQGQSYKYKSLSWGHPILRGWGVPWV